MRERVFVRVYKKRKRKKIKSHLVVRRNFHGGTLADWSLKGIVNKRELDLDKKIICMLVRNKIDYSPGGDCAAAVTGIGLIGRLVC